MKVLESHDFFDLDVEKVLWEGHKDIREIVLSKKNEGSLLLAKEDVIELAREFGLLVFGKDAKL